MSSQIINNSILAESLAQPFLTKTDEESILRFSKPEQIFSVLQNTPLVTYLSNEEEKNITQLENICERYLYNFKQQTYNASLQQEVYKILWAAYDFHNLSVLLKAKVSDKDFSETDNLLSGLGFYDKQTLYDYFVNDTLYQLDPLFHDAYHKAYRHLEAEDVARAELEIEKHYWLYCKNYSVASQNIFIQDYLKTVIDLANIFSRIRGKNNSRIDFTRYYIPGGNYGIDSFSTSEDAIDLLENYGGMDRWRTAVEECVSKGEGIRLHWLKNTYVLEYIELHTKTVFSVTQLVHSTLKVQLECKKITMLIIASLYGVAEEKIVSFK